LQNKLNIEYFTCGKLKDIFNIYIYGFAYMYINKLGNLSIDLVTLVGGKFTLETREPISYHRQYKNRNTNSSLFLPPPKWPILCRVGRWTLLTHPVPCFYEAFAPSPPHGTLIGTQKATGKKYTNTTATFQTMS